MARREIGYDTKSSPDGDLSELVCKVMRLAKGVAEGGRWCQEIGEMVDSLETSPKTLERSEEFFEELNTSGFEACRRHCELLEGLRDGPIGASSGASVARILWFNGPMARFGL